MTDPLDRAAAGLLALLERRDLTPRQRLALFHQRAVATLDRADVDPAPHAGELFRGQSSLEHGSAVSAPALVQGPYSQQ